MNNPKSKDRSVLSAFEKIADISSTPHRSIKDVAKLRKINPLGMRVLVEILKESNVTEGGLYLPEGAKEAMQESLLVKVLEVASASDEHSEEEHNVSGIPLGALVLIPKDVGIRVPWDANLRIVETKDVLAVVNEVAVD